MKRSTSIIWGIVLVAIGVIFALNALEITNIELFFDGWWTLFIIVPCLIDLCKGRNLWGNIMGIIIGALLLLSANELFDFAIVWKLFLPFVVIVIGLKFIFRDTFDKKVKELEAKLKNNPSEKEYYATFSGQNVDMAGCIFDGASLSAVFGGVKYDLRNAIINEDSIIEASAIFGGVTILLPANVKVKVASTDIFGGVSNKHQSPSDATVTVYVKGTCLFGGVDVK